MRNVASAPAPNARLLNSRVAPQSSPTEGAFSGLSTDQLNLLHLPPSLAIMAKADGVELSSSRAKTLLSCKLKGTGIK